MSRYNRWDEEDFDSRDFKKPKRIEKDKFNKHRKAIYDMIDDEDEEYFDDSYSYEDYDEVDDRY